MNILGLVAIIACTWITVAASFDVQKRRIGMRLPNFLTIPQESPLVQKRRIGMRLPNFLKYSGDYPSSQLIDKRRMGMRLPNIIYLRENSHFQQKKFSFD